MRQQPMRLGVLGLLLLVISILLTTLGVLTLSTAQADLRLSERYAETTTQQYQREASGQEFLRDVDRALKEGMPIEELEGVTRNGDIYEKTIATGPAALRIELRLNEEGSYDIVRWETDTQWSPQSPTGGLWGGQEE